MQTLQRLILEALGEASMCWSEQPTGVFDDQRVVRIGERLMKELKTNPLVLQELTESIVHRQRVVNVRR